MIVSDGIQKNSKSEVSSVDSNLGPRCEASGTSKDLPTLGPRVEGRNETRNLPCVGKRVASLKPELFGKMQHELDSPNMGGHLPHHPKPCYNLPLRRSETVCGWQG
ncbi:hypothetical protein AVEN_255327-1 [Araneus ventricosus]|uniref:Uncharacterized protein n=1 Tax=Araneus ventricosus TaxID=182803 RepID=A0A4Y2RKZ9_ARAVE|nr:hypothetical protein AVEN_255327-1 [Araneus ventricosus]